jgi:adenine-specific DNA-methyltransferase
LNKEIIGYRTDDGEYRVVQKTRLTGKMIRSLQVDKEISSRRGTAAVEELFGEKVFSFPKSVELIRRFIAIATKPDSIVLDFFSGSATTAHAVFLQNSMDQGARRFVLVQLPEQCSAESTAAKAGYKSIAEISKERIRRSGKKIAKSSTLIAPDLDTGFRVLKVDTSNMNDVHYTPDDVVQELLGGMINNIREDRTSEDLLFQVLLDWGVDLTLPITQESIDGKTVYFVDGNVLAACFEQDISEEFVKLLAKREPLRAVFRDSGFASDSVKINVEQIFKLISPTTEVKAI